MATIIDKFSNAAIGKDSAVLKEVRRTSKNIAIYQRDIAALQLELNQISGQFIECRASGTSDEIAISIKDYFDTHLTTSFLLYNDVIHLLELFKETAKAPSFRLLLTTVNTNMCRKFHTDVNDLRLLCTYMGPGTLWIPDEAINHKALYHGSEEQNILLDGHQIQQVSTGNVTILKGALYAKANPILHRSPPIEQSGQVRLLLRIDTNGLLDFI